MNTSLAAKETAVEPIEERTGELATEAAPASVQLAGGRVRRLRRVYAARPFGIQVRNDFKLFRVR
jgi:hypothetical protein